MCLKTEPLSQTRGLKENKHVQRLRVAYEGDGLIIITTKQCPALKCVSLAAVRLHQLSQEDVQISILQKQKITSMKF